MIKIKSSILELTEFSRHLTNCTTYNAKSGDLVKEFYLSYSIEKLNTKILKKIFAHKIDNKQAATITIKIDNAELIALSIYFSRYQTHPYLLKLETSIISQIPSELINILKPTV